jgi:hypothetical protein
MLILKNKLDIQTCSWTRAFIDCYWKRSKHFKKY